MAGKRAILHLACSRSPRVVSKLEGYQATSGERRVNAVLREQSRLAASLQSMVAHRTAPTPGRLRRLYVRGLRVVSMLENYQATVRRK